MGRRRRWLASTWWPSSLETFAVATRLLGPCVGVSRRRGGGGPGHACLRVWGARAYRDWPKDGFEATISLGMAWLKKKTLGLVAPAPEEDCQLSRPATEARPSATGGDGEVTSAHGSDADPLGNHVRSECGGRAGAGGLQSSQSRAASWFGSSLWPASTVLSVVDVSAGRDEVGEAGCVVGRFAPSLSVVAGER